MPAVSFSHPWYLLLLPLLIAGAVYVSRHSLADLRGSRARWSLGLRIAILACAVLALAGLQLRQPARTLAVLFVLDQSDSIPPAQKSQMLQLLNEAARKMGPNDEAGVLVFGSDAYLELEPGPLVSLKQVHSLPSGDYTNIAGAVRLALASFPENSQRRVMLLSDGNENLGSAVQEASTAVSAQVQVDVVPVSYRYDHEVLLEKMIIPSEAKVGEPFEVRLVARSTEKTSAVIRLLRNGELIAQQSVDLLAGPNVVNFHQSLDRARFHTYEAIVEAKTDQLPDNNRALGFVLVKGKPKVLIVESNPADARFLANSLQGQQLEVDVRQPGRLPATLAEFQTYDSVVLSNVGAYQLTPDQMKAIRSSVRDLGTGLVMIGGENSFGPGAYRGTPIEEALPVDMEVRKHKVMPVGAVAMVLHTCEFPDGNRWARETAATVVDVLGERDKVGVLLYGMKGEEWGIPMQSAANKEKIKAELYNLEPGDMPDFHRIVQMALQGLTTDAKEASVKHIIVISDGDPSPPSPELMAQLRKAKITMSCVAVFPHGSNNLPPMAKVGGGEYYNVRSPAEIPRIFLKEAQRVLKPAIIEETFRPSMLKESQLLTGIDAVPPLLGYVATTPKQAPSVEVAMTSPRDDPIFAYWRYGLGKAVAFMSDAKNRWAAPWVASGSTFTKFWAQTIRWTVRSTARADLDAQVEISQRRGKVVVDAVDRKGNFVNGLDIRGSVAGEKVSPKLRMEQTAPGRYEGEFEAPEKGQYMVGLSYTDPGGTPRVHTVGAAVPYSPEYRDLAANTAVLTNLADKTGGKIYPTLAPKLHEQDLRRVWRRDRVAHSAPQDLWPMLLLAAALLLPADIAVRRLMISRAEWAAFAGAVYGATLGRLVVNRRSAEQEEAMGRLLSAKMGAARHMGATGAAEEQSVEAPPAAGQGQPIPEAPARPQYEGPARTMPTVAGAGSVTPPPAAARARPPVADSPELQMTAPEPAAGAAPQAAAPAAPATEEPAKVEPAKVEPTPAAKPEAPAAPATAAAGQGSVVWHKPVEGVTPAVPARGHEQKPQAGPESPGPGVKQGEAEADSEEDSTNRLLRAKRRAREKQE
jgi:uncharacterized membrane protein